MGHDGTAEFPNLSGGQHTGACHCFRRKVFNLGACHGSWWAWRGFLRHRNPLLSVEIYAAIVRPPLQRMLSPALAANARNDAERLYTLKRRRSNLILKSHEAIGECETGTRAGESPHKANDAPPRHGPNGD